jgi:hypothetical protein
MLLPRWSLLLILLKGSIHTFYSHNIFSIKFLSNLTNPLKVPPRLFILLEPCWSNIVYADNIVDHAPGKCRQVTSGSFVDVDVSLLKGSIHR